MEGEGDGLADGLAVEGDAEGPVVGPREGPMVGDTDGDALGLALSEPTLGVKAKITGADEKTGLFELEVDFAADLETETVGFHQTLLALCLVYQTYDGLTFEEQQAKRFAQAQEQVKIEEEALAKRLELIDEEE